LTFLVLVRTIERRSRKRRQGVSTKLAAARREQKAGGAMSKLKLNVNGAVHELTASADTPLLYILRNELGLHGPRFGCGLAQCGACGVLVNGREVRSCVTPAAGVVGKPITTLEGLQARWANQRKLSPELAKTTLHPVQQAWIDEQVPMCGYCQNGMIIMAVDLLERVPSPSHAQIVAAFTDTPPSPHICRCGTYTSIMAAVKRASKSMASANPSVA
jgi:isoquinoline 1-oxidoreductase alpha subunit